MRKLKEMLLLEHSKKNTLFIVNKILQRELKLSDVFLIIKLNEPVLAQRAAWIISTLNDRNPQLIAPHLKDLISLIDRKHHDAVLRATFRTLATKKIKDNEQGEVFEKSILLLNNKHTATAIKIWIIDVLMNIAKPHPELQTEIATSLSLQRDGASKGLKGKITKTIVKINDNFE
ncbi:MAG: hypothetical protein ACJA0Q_001972 [Saprospiraceae bacterium]